MSNRIPGRYRAVSVADVDVELTEASLRGLFLGREAYRHTAFIAVRRGTGAALVAVTTADRGPLFSPILKLDVLAGPEECALVDAPDIDVGVPTQMGRVARQRAPGKRCVIVTGRYRHVSFLLDPAPLAVRVVEVAPPTPAKLVDQAARVLEVAEDLPPIDLQPDVVDLVALAAERPAKRYLVPCRGSGMALPGGEVAYLDERPARQDWVLVGCARSRQLHRWFYGDEDPPSIDLCPRALARERVPEGTPTLTKCCLLEEVERVGSCVTVPWGASLEQVRQGLGAVADLVEPAWAPA
ncbi:MAG TPA: hypothetical protein VFW71_04435 [Actinomycetota bacterium]|nr:hypothetical protein [Actinomycetota bacterium]